MNLIPGRLSIALGFSTMAHAGLVWIAGDLLPSTAAPAQRALTVSMTPAAPRAVLNSIAPAAAAAIAPEFVEAREPERVEIIDEPEQVLSAESRDSADALEPPLVETRAPEHTLEARESPSSMLAFAVVRQGDMAISKAVQREAVEKPLPRQLDAAPAAARKAESRPAPAESPVPAAAREPPARAAESAAEARTQAAVAGQPGADRNAQPAAGNEPPRYPWTARLQGQQGRVVLSVWVSADGEAERLAVLQSSGHALLDRAALEAVERWHFQPARRAGSDTASMVYVPVVFRLDE